MIIALQILLFSIKLQYESAIGTKGGLWMKAYIILNHASLEQVPISL